MTLFDIYGEKRGRGNCPLTTMHQKYCEIVSQQTTVMQVWQQTRITCWAQLFSHCFKFSHCFLWSLLSMIHSMNQYSCKLFFLLNTPCCEKELLYQGQELQHNKPHMYVIAMCFWPKSQASRPQIIGDLPSCQLGYDPLLWTFNSQRGSCMQHGLTCERHSETLRLHWCPYFGLCMLWHTCITMKILTGPFPGLRSQCENPINDWLQLG